MAKLPKTDGIDPIAARLKVNGLSSTVDEASKPGTKVFMLAELEVYGAGIEMMKAGPVREEKARFVRHMLVDESEAVARLNEHDELMADRNSEGTSQPRLAPVE